MPRSFKGEPKYLMCTRALALVTGLAGSVAVGAGTASANIYEGGPLDVTANPDAADAGTRAAAYDGGIQGVRVMEPDGCGCYLDGAPESPTSPLAAALVGAGLIASRRRRSDAP